MVLIWGKNSTNYTRSVTIETFDDLMAYRQKYHHEIACNLDWWYFGQKHLFVSLAFCYLMDLFQMQGLIIEHARNMSK
jgi:cytochrome c oxidase subunit IV